MRNCNNNTLFAGCSFCSLQYERDMNIYNFFNNIPMEMRREMRGSFSLFTHLSMLASLWLQNLNKQASGRCI